MSGPTIITATAPTPNGPLHLGHLSGPYIAADIAARAARSRGEDVVTVSGIDPHQNYVVAKAEQLGRDTVAVSEEYSANIRSAWRRARISYDFDIDPLNDADYRHGVSELLSMMVTLGSVDVRESEILVCGTCERTLHHAYVSGICPVCSSGSGGGTCEPCGSFVTAKDLEGAVCHCGGSPVSRTAEIPVLRLEDHREHLTRVWASASLSPSVRKLVNRYLDQGLPELALAYPTDWGISSELPGSPRIDVWVEMGLGLLHTLAPIEEPGDRTIEAIRHSWRANGPVWNFLGIDNAFYFAVMFPALAAALGIDGYRVGALQVNEFSRLSGAKFSTSRNHAIWADDFLAENDVDLLRLYFSWIRPDRFESDFTEKGMRHFQDLIFEALRNDASATTTPVSMAEQELERATSALSLDGYDLALAARSVTWAYPHLPDQAGGLLNAILGRTETSDGDLPRPSFLV